MLPTPACCRVLGPVGVRRLRDHGLDPDVLGGDRDDVAAGEARAPERDAGGVDPVERAGEGDRGAPVLVLAPDREQLARLAGRVPEVAVVEDERGDAGVAEALGVGPQARRAGAGETVGEDHDRLRALAPPARIGPVEPGGAALAARFEVQVLALGHCFAHPTLLQLRPAGLDDVLLAGSANHRGERIGRVVTRLPAQLLLRPVAVHDDGHPEGGQPGELVRQARDAMSELVDRADQAARQRHRPPAERVREVRRR